jgi:hypothetical protein
MFSVMEVVVFGDLSYGLRMNGGGVMFSVLELVVVYGIFSYCLCEWWWCYVSGYVFGDGTCRVWHFS